MPLSFPYDVICFLFGAVGLFFYLMYLRKLYLRKEKLRKTFMFPQMEFLVTGLDINLIKLVINGEEPFQLASTLVQRLNGGNYLIKITGSLKNGYSNY